MPDLDLRTTVGAVAIERDVVRVHGPEAVTYLQGQLSQDVEALAVGASARSLLLQPTGKVEAWLRVTRTAEDELLLDVDAGFGPAVLTRLQRFKLRTKADLEQETWSGWSVRGPGAIDAGWPAGWPAVDGYDVLGPDSVAPVGVPVGSASALEALRVELGVPAMGADLTDATIPAEAGQWLIDASVSFTKGCYTGQELVARIDSRGGNVPRPLRGLRLDGEVAARGTEVRVDGTAVGTVTSSARSPALGAIALAPLPRSLEIGAVVEVADQPATVSALPMR